MSRLYMMVSITNRSMRNKFQDFFAEYGNSVVFTTLGRGTANSAVLDYLGLEASEKLVTFSVVTDQMWKKLKRGLIHRMQIDVPGTGIAFIVPMGSIGGRRVLEFLLQDQEYEKEEESELKGTELELLMAIANQGCIDSVMDAARSANAGGGTVIHAKGTGMKSAERFLGVSLAEEKEIILIVAKSSEKNAIMKAIMEKSGLKSKDKAIVFSLPVTAAVGVRLEDDQEDDA
ncbi:MAG TPA: P-II family nitrogen regulator [Candidatus Scybalocola faecigallinarum]|uniref:P-II family nitrogen regulator n=1 Tax=Candidatus Scybalocola faecigallinarum TaxID=2840941 RepID=A0A9D1F7L9_9FIRM|nr:P-II family nitrogen regulator [Candidatus Scybalocola faecigallinarum]